MQASSTETNFLTSLSKLKPHSEIDKLLLDLHEDFDWELLVKTSLYHGVTWLLCQNLLQASRHLVPKDIYHAAKIYLDKQLYISQNHADQLSFLIQELESINVVPIPFKGLVLANKIYGKLNLRPSRDIDILIQQKDIDACINKLKKLGYSQRCNLTPRQWREFVRYAGEDILFGPGVPVEPHWEFAPSTLAINLDYGAIWKRAYNIEFNGHPVLTLSPEDELIMLCIHGCKEEWSKLKWVVDVSELICSHPQLNWSLVIDIARSQHVARIVRVGILLAHKMLKSRLPEQVQSWISLDIQAQSMVSEMSDRFFISDWSELDIWKPGLFHWSMRERLQDRLRYVVLTATQPRIQHFVTTKIPDSLFLLYWPYRPLHDFILLPFWRLLKRLYLVRK